MDKVIIIIVTFIPSIAEAFMDRRGETRKGKRKDAAWLIVVVIGLAGVAWWAGYAPLSVIGLVLMWRFCTFDYITHALLKRYSEGHKYINIWRYSGGTADYDKLTAKVPWKVRLILRAIVFLAALILYHIHIFPHKA